MGHTPGPWYVGKYGDNDSDVCAEGGPVICALRSGNADPHDMTADADALLIAAAPEMLAALKRMREVFEQLSDGDWRSLDATYVDQLIESDGLHGCDQAIAKAEGRE
jgi:hypothetical protein